MFKKMASFSKSDRCKNLASISFKERSTVENIIEQLASSAKDAYAASLPMIASAELGDNTLYESTRNQMLNTLEDLGRNQNDSPLWMQNNSFKAWMWGRVLLAADSMCDNNTAMLASTRLKSLLNGKAAASDNFAFLHGRGDI